MSDNLSPDQVAVVEGFKEFLTSSDINEICLLGEPGVGKTFVTRYLVDMAINHNNMLRRLGGLKAMQFMKEVYVTATTNKACTALTDATGITATTIHKLLGVYPKPTWQSGNEGLLLRRTSKKISNAIIFIDEAGMADKGKGYDRKLLYWIDERLVNCKVVFIGDDRQVTAVGEKSCPAFERGKPTFHLTTQHRQASQLINGKVILNPIEKLAKSYRNAVTTGKFPTIVPDGVHVIQCTGKEFKEQIGIAFTANKLAQKNKILAWTNAKVNQYNAHVRALHTGSEVPFIGEVMTSAKSMFDGSGDQYISNEEVVVITDIVPTSRVMGGVTFEGYLVSSNLLIEQFMPANWGKVKTVMNVLKKKMDWDSLKTIENDWLDLRPGYACTIQKSQGSTYEKVFINLKDVGACFDPAAVARLLVTSVSRASKQVYLYGDLPKEYGGNS